MLELSLPGGLREKGLCIAKAVEDLEAKWPKQIVLSAGSVSIYDCFPYLFQDAFPSVDQEQLHRFALAARLYASSIFLHDKLFDQGEVRDAHTDVAPINSMRILAMQWEAYRQLHDLFPPRCIFWDDFESYLRHFTRASLEEQRFVGTSRSWREFSEELALDIAKGKNGIARATIAGLCQMEDDRGPLRPLAESIDCYNCARQMLDDLTDWKEDLKAGMPSLLLVRVLGEKPGSADCEPFSKLAEQVAHEIFYNSHASYVLTLALRKLDEAEAALAPWPKLAWRKVHNDLRNECSQLLADIERIVEENVVRVNHQAHFELHLPAAANRIQDLAWQALYFLIEQWRHGFGEARHVMHFPPELSFTGPAYQRGDIFQRALITDALCEAEQAWNLNLRPVIDEEIAYFMSRRDSGPCGWIYFPELAELPPDADDLAQILQVLHRCGRDVRIQEICSGPVAVLLGDNSHPDGSFETWIIPAHNRSAREERQAEFARKMWGTGPDAEVMANLLYALALIDGDRYGDWIARGAEYLERQRSSDGTWTSTWYHGPFYGTYVCLRLLSRVRPHSPAIRCAATFLKESQNADGGWGNPLDTALALLALANTPDGEFHSASKAFDYLRAHAMPDGGWSDCEFIRMDLGRAAGAGPQIVSYGSRTITTMFVLKAAAVWSHREALRNC